MQARTTTEPGSGRPQRASYDAVVIGAGIGGLTAGALLTQAGREVLVVDAASSPGGHARALREAGRVFDPAVHLIMGCGDGGLVDAVLRHLGVRERCEFVAVDPFYALRFPGFDLSVPSGAEPNIEAHSQAFPADADGFRQLARLCERIYSEFLSFPAEPRLLDLATAARRFPTLFRYRNATLRDVLDRELGDERARATYAALWPYIGLPPGRMSLLAWGVAMASYMGEGAFYCRGGFEVLADALAQALTEQGGELLLDTSAIRVRVRDGRVSGVELAHGEEVTAPLVVSNISPLETFGSLVDAQKPVRRYLKGLARLEPSISTLGLYLATDLDVRSLGAAQETVVASTWDAERHDTELAQGRVPGMIVTIPGVTDRTVAPEGESTVALMCFAPREVGPDADRERRLAQQLLVHGERVLPGLAEHVTRVAKQEGAPEAELPLHRIDTIYGWAATPRQSAQHRLSQKTPIEGLRLVGHWTQPGHGIWSVMLSAIWAVRAILGKDHPTSAALRELR